MILLFDSRGCEGNVGSGGEHWMLAPVAARPSDARIWNGIIAADLLQCLEEFFGAGRDEFPRAECRESYASDDPICQLLVIEEN